jgi:bifunctional non-homologous end joining protein LigD
MKPAPQPAPVARPKRSRTRSPAQALLQTIDRTPLPSGCTSPMLATLGTMPGDLENYGYEVKWDGYRALARWDGRRFKLCSRNGNDLAHRFHEIAPLQKALRRPVLLDGEIVAMDKDGRPSFSALQTRMPRFGGVPRTRVWDAKNFTLQYIIFDVLHYDGRSTCSLAYVHRRKILDTMALAGPAWQVPPVHPDGPELLAIMHKARMEGLIAKRLTSIYQIGKRSPDWIKVKLNRSEEFLIIGYWSSGKHGLSSLLLGCYASASDARLGRNLRFCGKVGTGFAEDERRQLQRALDRVGIDHPPVTGDRPKDDGIVWCRPHFVAQIHYSEWTHDGSLRHPAFMGLRSDKKPNEVIHPPGAP